MLHVTRHWFGPGEDKTDCFRLRTQVFIEEQKFQEEFDDIDDIALHLLLTQEGEPVATARIFEQESRWWIGRICVAKHCRKDGMGTLALLLCEDKLREIGAEKSYLKAQMQAKGFYEKAGYRAQGEVFEDEGCAHILMYKDLTAPCCGCHQ